jgi:putative heme-binding domain-containing protein
MPAFASLGNSGITSVGAFLRSLQGKRALARLPGDPQIGKALFFGKAGCSECHMVNGSGGFIGADLSSFAANRSVEEVRDAITNPGKNMEARDKTMVVTMQDGKQYVGIARNEDNFSLQLQTLDGAFHFYTKAELQNVKRLSSSLMPSDYSSRLTRRELDHVVSYLLATARASKPEKGSKTPAKHADND